MGLFDKKKKSKDDFDSPVEQIDLSAAPASSAGADDDDDYEEVVATPAPAPASQRSGPLKAPQPAAPPPVAAQRSTRPTTPPSYGIDDAVSLMRSLPQDNVELVVQVVKHTLESAKIDIATIIDDASAKVDRIESRVTVLRSAIADLEREIQTRRDEIDKLEADRRETTRVRERLLLAQKLTAPVEKRERSPSSSSAYHPVTAAAPAEPLPGLSSTRTPRTTGEMGAARERPAPQTATGLGPADTTLAVPKK